MKEIKKVNFHNHTTFCDGHSTAEEMALAAISKNFDILGFSSHSMLPFAAEWHIPFHNHQAYVDEINRLKQLYKDKIDIRLGFEADYIKSITVPDKNGEYKKFNPDFLIGSVHYVVTSEGNFTVDDTTENVKSGLETFYKNHTKDCVHDYFEAQRNMLKEGNFDIWGHPDLIRKRNGILHFFDENDSWYKEELKLTAKTAASAGVIAEINTGAIARGAMDDLYPSREFMKIIHSYNIPVIIDSDCHNAPDIDAAWDRAIHRALEAGYTELTYPDYGKFKTIKLSQL